MKIPSMSKEEMKEVNENILSLIDEFGGINPVLVDVKGRSSIADYFIIAHFNSKVAMEATYEAIASYMKDQDLYLPKQDRKGSSPDWIAIDGGFIVCHLMSEEARNFYNIEKLWELEGL